MGRPKIPIDAELVEKMASWGCKTVDIAEHFGCDSETITRRFMAELTKGRVGLRTNLRQWQLQSARGGNVVMLIWLGKQLLDQKDVSRLELTEIPDETFAQEAERRIKLVGGG